MLLAEQPVWCELLFFILCTEPRGNLVHFSPRQASVPMSVRVDYVGAFLVFFDVALVFNVLLAAYLQFRNMALSLNLLLCIGCAGMFLLRLHRGLG